MKKLLFLLFPFALFAQLNVAVAYPYIGAVTEKIGKEHINVNILAPGSWDPHFVVPRPSLIAKMRSADALIINGGQLEIGWLPALIQRSNNPNVQPGSNGFLDLSMHVKLLHEHEEVSRAGGDVHPEGNPHFHLAPANILLIAAAVAEHLGTLDPKNTAAYQSNLKTFEQEWQQHMQRWGKALEKAKDIKVIQYHNLFAYFLETYGIESIGAIEPLPGIPPSSKHTMELIELIEREKPYCILHDVYHATKTAEFISRKTGIEVATIPHDIGSLDSVETLTDLFDFLVETLTK